ncbi:hypothetical protein [Streptomyces microflavus]|uniref:hypothetical protein n=1 Tax=Streptomyces microflavus TaxID=1919 RepID=UPI003B2189E8
MPRDRPLLPDLPPHVRRLHLHRCSPPAASRPTAACFGRTPRVGDRAVDPAPGPARAASADAATPGACCVLMLAVYALAVLAFVTLGRVL